jgi:diaminopimelate epimerase
MNRLLEYIKCYPGGNVTIIILSKVSRIHQACIAKWIMKRHLDVEQVGFWEKPTQSIAVARLQMAGGEFSGNGARCLAYIFVKRQYSNQPDIKHQFFLEISGTTILLEATVNSTMVSIDMPVKNFNVVKKISEKIAIVYLDGITHILVKGYTPRNFKSISWTWINKFNLQNNRSVGVVYYRPIKNGIKISPVVWVRDVSDLILETSCGSASISLALSLFLNGDDNQLTIYQPSGSVIYTLIEHQNEIINRASIKGSVSILEEGHFSPE